jgi:ATP-binding cassette subfamily C (CFTR/MRP) protein 4
MVGERGITLSGGQKARLTLARALYSDADIYLFDDPISAVDAKVAKKIYEHVIQKLRGSKTIVLVTHQISYMYGCDEVVIMEDGKVVNCDTPEKLKYKLN